MEETKPGKSKNNSYFVALIVIIFSLAFAVFAFRQKDQSEKYRERDNENQQVFHQKGYLLDKDIKELKNWGVEANEIPDLKPPKRRGVVNTLSVSVSDKKGYCSELVIILKESPYVKADILNYKIDGLSSMKIKQSREFADTEDIYRAVIKFAINKIIEKGHTWKYDVYVIKTNSNAENISGPSSSSGAYLALLSAFYSDCVIPKNLAITGEFKVEGEEIPTKIKSLPKKYQWSHDHCANCGEYSYIYHFIYDRITNKLEEEYHKNATNPDSQWAFCKWECYNQWWDKNVYNCSECGRQRFGNCSCCSNYHGWIWENKNNERFCSEKCINKRYPKEYEEGKIVAIGRIGEKVSAAVEKGCDTIIIPKSNLDYYTEVPLSVRAKVENLHEIESYKDLEKFLTTGLYN